MDILNFRGRDHLELTIQHTCSGINWQSVSDILKSVNMDYYDGEIHKKVFENSYSVVFTFHDDLLIGFGRAISDGIFQAALFDIAVLPAYQKKKVGTTIVNNLIQQLSGCNIYLFSTPGKEKFYEKLNFRRMKTSMALFQNPDRTHNQGYIE